MGKHNALHVYFATGSVAKPCVLSDRSERSRGSSSTVQMARSESLKGDPKVGFVKIPMVAMLTHTPGSQVGRRPIVVSNG